MKPPWVVAEVGCNHLGSVNTAKRMIEILATYCSEHFDLDRAHVTDVHRRLAVKFQKRTCDLELYPHWQAPHPNQHFAYGDTYFKHREALEFDKDDHRTLKFWAEQRGITYSCSVWDIRAARDIISLDPRWIKVPSACNLDFDLLEVLANEYAGDLHISLGMTARAEIIRLMSYLKSLDVCHRVVLYACTSGYPVDAPDVYLLELRWLRDRWGGLVKAFGLSGHHRGIAIDMAAVALGASYIERHYVLDRTMRHTDAAASLAPDGIRKLVRDVGQVAAAMNRKPGAGLVPVEYAQRDKLKVNTETGHAGIR
jgi:N-acetylneuraminate synthase